jgi:hypothetical protein
MNWMYCWVLSYTCREFGFSSTEFLDYMMNYLNIYAQLCSTTFPMALEVHQTTLLRIRAADGMSALLLPEYSRKFAYVASGTSRQSMSDSWCYWRFTIWRVFLRLPTVAFLVTRRWNWFQGLPFAWFKFPVVFVLLLFFIPLKFWLMIHT